MTEVSAADLEAAIEAFFELPQETQLKLMPLMSLAMNKDRPALVTDKT